MSLSSSNFIPIENGWSFLEFEYNSKIASTRDYSFIRILNNYDKTINYLNHDTKSYTKIKNFSNNILDNTSIRIDKSIWLLLDMDRPVKFYEQTEANLLFQNIEPSREIFVTYHKVKIHILKGYNFEGIDGFYTKVSYEDPSGNRIFVANQMYLKTSELKYHNRPILNGQKMYDRYCEFLIPDIKSLDEIYQKTSANLKLHDANFLNYKGNGEFPNIKFSRINILFYEINETKTDRYGRFISNSMTPVVSDIKGVIPIQLELNDVFSGIAAVIRESSVGDYFEFFPSYEGQFFEDYVNSLDGLYSNQFIIIHDIDLIEQSLKNGTYFEEKTSSISLIQTENFDKAFTYRPVIENNHTISFTMEYVMRIIDTLNNSQIIRKASLTYPFAQKYGRYIQKLDIENVNSIKVINKLVLEGNSIDNKQNTDVIYPYLRSLSYNTNNPISLMMPVDRNKLVLSNKNLVTKIDSDGNEILTTLDSADINLFNIYSSLNTHILLLYPFDSFILFSIKEIEYTQGGTKFKPYNFVFNSNNIKYFLNFLLGDGTYHKIEFYPINKITNVLEDGEIIFKMTASDYQKIKTTTSYNITLENTYIQDYKGFEIENIKDISTIIYQGVVKNSTE